MLKSKYGIAVEACRKQQLLGHATYAMKTGLRGLFYLVVLRTTAIQELFN